MRSGLLLLSIVSLILSKKFKFSFVVVCLTIAIDPIFLKYHQTTEYLKALFLK